MIDVVAVVLDKEGAVKYVLTQYTDYYGDEAPYTTPVSEFPAASLHYWGRGRNDAPDPIGMPQWSYPLRRRQSALRFQTEADLRRLPKLRAPSGTATFMDTSDYEAVLVMLKLAEA